MAHATAASAPLPRLRGAIAHATAGFVVVATSVVLTVLAVVLLFVALFVLAILYDAPLGSPVAAPAWCVIAAATAGAVGLGTSVLVLLPSTEVARTLCARSQGLSRFRPWSEIPVASAITLLLGALAGAAFNLSGEQPQALGLGLLLGMLLLLPLGLYWWTLTMSRFGLGGATKAGQALHRKVTVRE